MTNTRIKLKKYLLMISVAFFVATGGHLLYQYVYENSEITPVEGGKISEGIVGEVPAINPLNYNSKNRYLVDLLYQGLIRYDVEQKKVVGNLATCDLSNLSTIECSINFDAKWSDGTTITADDVVATYEIIKQQKVNKLLVSLLDGVEIQQRENVIVFKNSKKDIKFLNVLFQPIVKKEVIEKNVAGGEKAFDSYGVYSGPFVLNNISGDSNIGISKVELEKNKYSKTGNIAHLVLNYYSDYQKLRQNQQSVNIINDKDGVLGDSLVRFESNRYTLPKFTSLFINEEKVKNQQLRSFILHAVDRENLIKVLGDVNYAPVMNPYMTETDISQNTKGKNFEAIMASIGYKKKSAWLSALKKPQELEVPQKTATGTTVETNTTGTGATGSGSAKETVKAAPDSKPVTLADIQKPVNTIIKPSFIEKYNFLTKDDVLLQGKTNGKVDAVYVNEYKLKGFKPGNTEFYYRLRVADYASIKKGKNVYNIYFETAGKKSLQDEIIIFYEPEKAKLEDYKKQLLAEQTKSVENPKEKEAVLVEKKTNEAALKKYQEQLAAISKLDENIYYNEKLEPYTLSLYYIDDKGSNFYSITSDFIKSSLQNLGIKVTTKAIALQEAESLVAKKESYDMILIGLNLRSFNGLFGNLHSSQAEKGFNFSKVKNPNIDIMLEDLNENLYNEKKQKEVQDAILKNLQQEAVIKTLFTSRINLLVDKNLLGGMKFTTLPYASARKDILNSYYSQQERKINLKGKGVIGFFRFALKKIYE